MAARMRETCSRSAVEGFNSSPFAYHQKLARQTRDRLSCAAPRAIELVTRAARRASRPAHGSSFGPRCRSPWRRVHALSSPGVRAAHVGRPSAQWHAGAPCNSTRLKVLWADSRRHRVPPTHPVDPSPRSCEHHTGVSSRARTLGHISPGPSIAQEQRSNHHHRVV